MVESQLDTVQRLVDQLTPLDQARLLEYLAPRLARVVAGSVAPAPPPPPSQSADAWAEFFRVGDALAASDLLDGDTLTATVLAMRR